MTDNDKTRPDIRALRVRRPGMALRVAIGFAAVALAVIGANLVTQRSAGDARARVRQLLIHHEPLVRATESLAAAVSHYERVIGDEIAAATSAERQVEAAAERMSDAAAAYHEAARRFPEPIPIVDLGSELAEYRAFGDQALRASSQRRERVRAYWRRFEELEQLANAPHRQAARFAGAVFASETLLELGRSLSVVRERVSAAATVNPSQVPQTVIAAENEVKATLKSKGAELARLHGEQWLADVNTRFAHLVAARRNAFGALAELQDAAAQFHDKGALVSGIVVTQLVEPARRALANADELAVRAAERADRQLVWASATVLLLLTIIAIATVTSVTLPVQRLTVATRRIAGGVVRTRVPRGGVHELDQLAGAFNQMAEQLEHAEQEVQAYQAELEAKVDERTRELSHLAHHDPLTQLPNRRQLFTHLAAAIDHSRSAGSRVAVLFIDLDNFKTINDGLGHAFGDRVLQAVGERLMSLPIFARAFCSRLGGDEFMMVCEVQTLGEVERLGASVAEEFQRPLPVHGRELRISVSIGASVFPDHAGDAQALLRAADAALFRAKERGRNCCHLFVPELLAAAANRFKVEQALRRAVERGEFELLYQPQVSFDSFETQTVEALLRWRRPDGNLISPTEFFEVAEQSGLITDISDWALRTAIQAAVSWQSGPWPNARVAVNVSSQQFISGDFVERLQSLLQQHALPARCLEIELTENVLQTGPTTIAALHRLRDIGVTIALDDFGTGYSSLTSLERLPLTRVKIDRSLVATIDTGPRAPAIVRSIIGLCHSLGLQVTAEGLERPSQLGVLLVDRGVQVQGFLVARPMAAALVPTFLSKTRAHLQQLLIEAPPPDVDSSGVRFLRSVRTAAIASAKAGTPSSEEG